jgi:transposase
MYYIGLDVHKKSISYCVKDASGQIHAEGAIPATRFDLGRWMKTLPQPWTAAMEATLFTGWIYDHLLPHAAALKVAHPLMLRAIAAAKKKNDQIDANKIADGLRCDFLPECYMASTEIRERRRTLRYRNLLVRQAVQLKNKISGLLRLQKTESALVRSLEHDPLLAERVERLMTIPAVGPITALTWVLEIGDVKRFSSIKKAISYCGLCGAENSSANMIKRTPLPKQRNKQPGEAERKREPSDPRCGTQACGLLGRRGSTPKRISNSRKRKPHRRIDGGEIRRFLQRAVLPGLASSRLGEGVQAPDAPFGLFQDWREITNSIFCEGRSWPRQQMDVWFCYHRNRRREARTRAEGPEKPVSRAPPERVRRALALLTRTHHGRRLLGTNRWTTALSPG